MKNFEYDIYFWPIKTDWDEPQVVGLKSFSEAENIILEMKRTDLCIVERLGDKVNHTYTISGFKWDEKEKIQRQLRVGDIVMCHKESYKKEYGKEFEVLEVKETGFDFLPNIIRINNGSVQWVNGDAFMSKEHWQEYIDFINRFVGDE